MRKEVVISKETYDKFFDIACHLENEKKFYKLGILAEMLRQTMKLN